MGKRTLGGKLATVKKQRGKMAFNQLLYCRKTEGKRTDFFKSKTPAHKTVHRPIAQSPSSRVFIPEVTSLEKK